MSDEGAKKLKWKSGLLSSSLPLEYEVAKDLVKAGLIIHHDYSYERRTPEGTKDFSTDFLANGWLPKTKDFDYSLWSGLLVECKYRDPSKKWVFIRDANRGPSASLPYATFRFFDGFSAYRAENQCMIDFEHTLPSTEKGVEINTNDGTATDVDIKHAINQLRYAMPSLILSRIQVNAHSEAHRCVPFLICPILVTNAELFVANRSFGMNSVRESQEVTDFAKPVPCLVTASGASPDFENHCKREFASLEKAEDWDKTGLFRMRDKKVSFYDSPSWIAKDLREASPRLLHFNSFVVCQQKALGSFLGGLEKASRRAIKGQRFIFTDRQAAIFDKKAKDQESWF